VETGAGCFSAGVFDLRSGARMVDIVLYEGDLFETGRVYGLVCWIFLYSESGEFSNLLRFVFASKGKEGDASLY